MGNQHPKHGTPNNLCLLVNGTVLIVLLPCLYLAKMVLFSLCVAKVIKKPQLYQLLVFIDVFLDKICINNARNIKWMQYYFFFQKLNHVRDIHIMGHSCAEIDYPYFQKIKETVEIGAIWHFTPYNDDDIYRIQKLMNKLGIRFNQTTGI